jgi:hypothetical protein
VAGGLARVVDAGGGGALPQARLPQHVWRHGYVVLVWEDLAWDHTETIA